MSKMLDQMMLIQQMQRDGLNPNDEISSEDNDDDA
jgi:hypothetical protein